MGVKDQTANGFTLASQSSSEGPAIMVRFASGATVSDITSFLATYKAQLIARPEPGNFYQIRISGLKSADEIATIVGRIQRESKIVDFVAARD
jgi:hypothetical protein